MPRGTTLLVNNWAIQNNAEPYPKSVVFRPERFNVGEVEGLAGHGPGDADGGADFGVFDSI